MRPPPFIAHRRRAPGLAVRRATFLILVLVFALPAAATADHRPPRWKPVPTGSDQQYRGLDAVDHRVAWVGGSAGEVLRTTDGGATWRDVSPPDGAGLLFRDVEAQSAHRASVLAIGAGDASRIFTTIDGGRNWRLAFVNDDPNAFYDCMDFFAGGRRGLALSDPVDGKFRIAATDDWGRSWHVLPNARHAAGRRGGVRVRRQRHVPRDQRRRDAWFGTGGGASRVFHSRDGGFTWTATAAPIPAAEAGGVFSLAFRNPREGVMVGGDFTAPENGTDASGFTRDGGDDLARRRRPLRLPLRRRLADRRPRDADRRRPDRLRCHLRRRAQLDGVRRRALRRRRLRARHVLGERPGRRRRRARPLDRPVGQDQPVERRLRAGEHPGARAPAVEVDADVGEVVRADAAREPPLAHAPAPLEPAPCRAGQ